MQEKVTALEKNGTWELVALPPGKRAVGCKWIYTVKLNPDWSLAHLKQDWLPKITHKCGLDYVDIFSPVAKMTSVQMMVSLAATCHWSLHQLNIKNALLNSILDKDIYMEQLLGFFTQGECGHKICRLKKLLYGLKQSLRAWFDHFASVIQEFDLCRTKEDHSLCFDRYMGRGSY